eukprot:3635555-Rhodomonas_salina.1
MPYYAIVRPRKDLLVVRKKTRYWRLETCVKSRYSVRLGLVCTVLEPDTPLGGPRQVGNTPNTKDKKPHFQYKLYEEC